MTGPAKITNSDEMYAYIAGYAYRDTFTDYQRLWYLDIYGPTTGVRAITATFVSGNSLHISGVWGALKKAPNVRFQQLSTSLVPGYVRTILFPRVEYGSFVITPTLARPGEEKWDMVVRVLLAHTIWPVKPEWAKALWKVTWHTDGSPIRRLSSNLDYAYLVDIGGDWGAILDKAVKNGDLKI